MIPTIINFSFLSILFFLLVAQFCIDFHSNNKTPVIQLKGYIHVSQSRDKIKNKRIFTFLL